jgi:hypothetical protein
MSTNRGIEELIGETRQHVSTAAGILTAEIEKLNNKNDKDAKELRDNLQEALNELQEVEDTKR